MAIGCAAALAGLSGCMSVRAGLGGETPSFQIDGLGTAYAAMPGVSAYNGNILTFDLFRERGVPGEWIRLGIWPLGGIDLGLLGVRLKLLPFEVGAGTLFYQPRKAGAPGVDVDLDGTVTGTK